MESITQEVVNLSFYKNPIFIIYIIYVSTIMISYLYMDDGTKNSYIFDDTYRDELGDIHWTDILTLDRDIHTVPDMLELFLSPFVLYTVVSSTLILTVVKAHEGSYQPYFYLFMMNIGILLLLFIIHYVSYKVFKGESVKREPSEWENTDISPPPGQTADKLKIKKDKRSYASTFRTQWILLVFLTPVISPIILYLIRLQGPG